MYLRLIIIFLIALPSWYFTDMDSPSFFLAYVLPIITFACFIAFCLWLIGYFQHLGESDMDNHPQA